jgi:hypothetical protein
VLVSLLVALAAPVYTAAQESLGDLARQVREQRSRVGTKPARVYTNDNLPARPPQQGPTAASGFSAATAGTAPSTALPPAIRPEVNLAEGAKKAAEGQGAAQGESSEDKVKTPDYWQSRFKSARAKLARAEEERQLVEDELNLIQIQQTRELDATAKQQLGEKVEAKQTEVDDKQAAADQARKALEDLETEFKNSGAPEDWSKTD